MKDEVVDLTFYGNPAVWRFRRHAAGGLQFSIRKQPGKFVTAQALGSTVTSTARHETWDFASVSRPSDDPRHSEYTRVKTGSLVLSSEARIDAALDTAAALYAQAAHLGEERLREGSQMSLECATNPGTEQAQLAMDGPELKKFTIQ